MTNTTNKTAGRKPQWVLETELVLKLAAAGESVRSIALKTGISKSTVSRIMLGQRVCDAPAPAPIPMLSSEST
jgi:transcriptional regulator with XRE-family HTH domain